MTQKRLVNWSSSMEITTKVFKQTEDYFIDSIRECAKLKLTNYNYGLLANSENATPSNNIHIHQHITEQIEIQVISCNAITASGVRINFNPYSEYSALTKTFYPNKEVRKECTKWNIIISTDPFQRKATGELNINETPPRYPDVEQHYLLHILPESESEKSKNKQHQNGYNYC